MGNVLKKNWFIVMLAVLFAGVSIFYIVDSNRGKLKGKTSNGESVVYEINGEDVTASEYYNELYDTVGSAALYQSFMKAVVSQAVETTTDMENNAASQAVSIVSNYQSNYPANWQSTLDDELKSMGYAGYDELTNYLIDYQKLMSVASDYAQKNFDDLKIRNVSYLLIRPENTESFSEEATEDEQARKDAVDEALSSGTDFAEVAKQYSEDPSTAPTGGVLGTLDTNTTSLDLAFKNASLSLKTGEVSDWVYSENFGWFRIKCNASDHNSLVNAFLDQNNLTSSDGLTNTEFYYDLLANYDTTLLPIALFDKGEELGITYNDESAEAKLKAFAGIND